MTRKKPAIKHLVSMALFLVLIGLLGAYVWSERQTMAQMLRLSWPMGLGMLLLALGSCLVNTLYHLVILRTYHLPLTLTDWMGVVSVSNAIAYVLPMRTDLVFTAAYYKRVKGLEYTKSASMAAGNIVFGVAFSLLQILAALLCMGLMDGVWPGTLWVLWFMGMALLTAFVLVALFFQERMPGFLKKYKIVRDVASGFTALLRNRAMVWRLLCCLTASNVFRLFLQMLCFRAIGHNVTFYQALFYNSVSWLSEIVAIVPGNIGIKETVMGASTVLLGIDFPTGVAASLLQRGAVMAVHLLMGAAFAVPVYRRFTQGKAQEPEARK